MHNQLELLKVFKVVAESTNFREAAVRLGISPQSVTRAIKLLEAQLGEPLFYRSTRSTSITAFGTRTAQKVDTLMENLEALFNDRRTLGAQEVAGTVRVTMSNVFGKQILLPRLIQLQHAYPTIQLDLRFSDHIDNVITDQMDIGVRIGFFSNNRYVARRANQIGFRIVGAPSLIEKTGEPRQISDLFKMPYTSLIDQNTGRLWPWSFAQESPCFEAEPIFTTDDIEAELAAAIAGIGYSQLPDFVCIEAIRKGWLRSVLNHAAPEPWGIYVYRPQRGPVAERVRIVFDALVDELSQWNVSP